MYQTLRWWEHERAKKSGGGLKISKVGSVTPITENQMEEELVKSNPCGNDDYLKGVMNPNVPPSPFRCVAYFLVHSWRTFGWAPPLLLLSVKRPKVVLALAVAWIVARRQDRWKNAIHDFVRFGSSNRPRLVRAQSKPYDTSKQYVIAIHPHGLLCCSWFNLLSRHAKLADGRNFSHANFLMDGLKCVLHTAQGVQFYPLHGEMYRNRCTDASSKSIRKTLKNGLSAVLSPGGFSEAVYTGWSDEYDVAYIDERYGFIKIAIEHGIDIIPTYSFGCADMYHGLRWKAHERAKKAQETGIPMVMWWGKYGTNIPLSEDTCTVSFDPFPSSKYTLDQVVQCHADYCAYLKSCFMKYRHLSPLTKNKQLLIVGKNTPPEDAIMKLETCEFGVMDKLMGS